ncbi:hypothetical protein MH117_25145 [Paenibacillus sp. ACRRX]|uniref:hypothetical protein n=1 Tax=unclassified Paenibacillus TaxID=185978 RepID=UPI001EF454AB|nr:MULTISPECIES: hypothetical protein [unclassified Paenibacillus]MCG7410685.1 hypothetical protein [Paenibacillus sp. ACRRX]MDK8184053.1 hypothetical protein [Paenibacillus sp. UMB4589-SE434]
MGMPFTRPYKDILQELAAAVGQIPDSYSFFDMESGDWQAMSTEERSEVLEALADDLFYGLGQENILFIGSGSAQHDRQFHVIEVMKENEVIARVQLVD